MFLFLGEHNPKLDEKGRLILPAKFRERLAGGIVVTRGQDRCLYVFPMAEFEKLVATIQSQPLTNRAMRDHTRMLLAGASDEVPDKQGRITIPQTLRDYAGLTKDCTVIGAGARIEIWDTQAWTDYTEQTEQSFADTAEEVIPGLV